MAQLIHTVSSQNVLHNVAGAPVQLIRNTSGTETNGRKNRKISLAPTKEELCYINVSGKQYITTFKCLEKHPRSLLGSPIERNKYWMPELKSYYFNHNRDCFDSILTFYQTGKEFKPLTVDEELYERERTFFKIDETSCETKLTILEDTSGTDSGGQLFCSEWYTTKRRVHRFLMDPRSSRYATGWHIMDIIFICISITLLVLETDPNVGHNFVDKSRVSYYYLYYVNVLVIAFFTVDLLIRFATWPNYLTFWKNLFNILDILSILPFYVSVIADAMENAVDASGEDHSHKSYVVLRVCRIFRIVRVFKFIRHSQDLIIIIKVVVHAKKELFLLMLLLAIFSMSFGSLMYYVEYQSNPQFTSIMTGCWWAIVTITTIGYGDIIPTTWLGKIVGSVVLTLGIVFLALPMTIIVGKFSTVYEKEKKK